MRKIRIYICVLSIMLSFFTGCANEEALKLPTEKTPDSREGTRHVLDAGAIALQTPGQKENRENLDLKVGFVFIGPIGDYGFNYSHNQGRLALMDELGVETMIMENVPEDEKCVGAIQSLINGGCTVIFTCSYGYMEYTAAMADLYPQIYFFHCSGYLTRDNMSTFFGRMYQVRYLTGIVAGLRTEVNKIGYIASFPIPEVIRGADAFALGVKSVNPDARIILKWSNTWVDPAVEKNIAMELIDEGCDVLAQHQDTILPQVAAQERGIWSIGYHSPMGFFSEDAYLTGAVWDWAPYMVEQVRNIANGTWKPSDYWGGIEDGIVRFEKLTKNVAPGTEEAVNKGAEAIMNGFDIFEGPVYDNKGTLRIPKGHVLNDEEKLSMDWFVDNIEIK